MLAIHILGYRVPELVVWGLGVGALFSFSVAWVGSTCGWSFIRRVGLVGIAGFVPVVLSVTLAPSASLGDAPGCLIALPSNLFDWGDDQRLLNVALFVPLGFCFILAIEGNYRHLVYGLALCSLAVGIEGLQNLTIIGRSCDVTDIFDNVAGVFIGGLIGLVLHRRR